MSQNRDLALNLLKDTLPSRWITARSYVIAHNSAYETKGYWHRRISILTIVCAGLTTFIAGLMAFNESSRDISSPENVAEAQEIDREDEPANDGDEVPAKDNNNSFTWGLTALLAFVTAFGKSIENMKLNPSDIDRHHVAEMKIKDQMDKLRQVGVKTKGYLLSDEIDECYEDLQKEFEDISKNIEDWFVSIRVGLRPSDTENAANDVEGTGIKEFFDEAISQEEQGQSEDFDDIGAPQKGGI